MRNESGVDETSGCVGGTAFANKPNPTQPIIKGIEISFHLSNI